MIKKTLIFFILTMAILTGFVLYEKFNKQPPKGFINQGVPQKINPSQNVPKEPNQDSVGLQIIREINEKNSRIKNFVCERAIVYTWHKGLRLKLNGSVHFEKPMNLKMKVSSIVGEEFFMGSNNNEFWFWSRRLSPPALYHAKHSDYKKTRLKSAFNPLMVMDSFGFKDIFIGEGIAVKEVKEGETTKIAIIEKTVNSIGQPIGHITFVDKANKRLLGHLVTDSKGEMIASSEILAYQNDLPSQILYTWYEEDQAMLLELPGGKTNASISDDYWVRSKMNKEIDMGATTVNLKWDFSGE